jgi:hypothetical protein
MIPFPSRDTKDLKDFFDPCIRKIAARAAFRQVRRETKNMM